MSLFYTINEILYDKVISEEITIENDIDDVSYERVNTIIENADLNDTIDSCIVEKCGDILIIFFLMMNYIDMI